MLAKVLASSSSRLVSPPVSVAVALVSRAQGLGGHRPLGKSGGALDRAHEVGLVASPNGVGFP